MNKQLCEWFGCKHIATQADTYQNMWLCDDHYSLLGIITGDYQDNFTDYNDIVISNIISK